MCPFCKAPLKELERVCSFKFIRRVDVASTRERGADFVQTGEVALANPLFGGVPEVDTGQVLGAQGNQVAHGKALYIFGFHALVAENTGNQPERVDADELVEGGDQQLSTNLQRQFEVVAGCHPVGRIEVLLGKEIRGENLIQALQAVDRAAAILDGTVKVVEEGSEVGGRHHPGGVKKARGARGSVHLLQDPGAIDIIVAFGIGGLVGSEGLPVGLQLNDPLLIRGESIEVAFEIASGGEQTRKKRVDEPGADSFFYWGLVDIGVGNRALWRSDDVARRLRLDDDSGVIFLDGREV